MAILLKQTFPLVLDGLVRGAGAHSDVFPSIFLFGWLATLISLEFVYFRFGQVTADIYRVLPRRDWSGFGRILLEAAFYTFFAMLAKAVALTSGKLLARAMRRNLSSVANKKILRMARENGLDNVDQRVTEDVVNFTEKLLVITETVALAPVLIAYYTVKAFGNVSWLGIVLIYAHFLASVLVVRGFVLRLKRLSVKREEREADYRAEQRNIQVNRGVEESMLRFSLLQRLNLYHVPRLMSIAKKVILTEAAIEAVNSFASYSGTILNFSLLAVEVARGRWQDKEDAAALAALISRSSFVSLYLIFQLSRVVALGDVLGSFGASVERLHEVLQAPEHIDIATSIDEKWSVRLDQFLGRHGNLTLYPQGLSFELSPGKDTLVVGRNGSGKTSLIRFITGTWTDSNMLVSRPYDQSRPFILVCPEAPLLFTGSLLDLLDISCHAVPLDGERLRGILATVGLGAGFGDVTAIRSLNWWQASLTPGQCHRLCLARVLWHRPHLVLLDETFASMDAHETARILACLRDAGITFMATGVEHRLNCQQEYGRIVNI